MTAQDRAHAAMLREPDDLMTVVILAAAAHTLIRHHRRPWWRRVLPGGRYWMDVQAGIIEDSADELLRRMRERKNS